VFLKSYKKQQTQFKLSFLVFLSPSKLTSLAQTSLYNQSLEL